MFYVLSFKVKATDAGGLYSEVNLKVKVKDKNDLTPRFSANNYEFDVGENVKAGEVSSVGLFVCLCFLHISCFVAMLKPSLTLRCDLLCVSSVSQINGVLRLYWAGDNLG